MQVVISSSGRPQVLTQWIRNGRKLENEPYIVNLEEYADEWWTWWTNLQPPSREKDAKAQLCQQVGADETWDELRKGSVNGFYGIVCTLAWWMKSLKTDEDKESFSGALDDVMWVLTEMLKVSETSQKRARDGDAKTGAKRQRVS